MLFMQVTNGWQTMYGHDPRWILGLLLGAAFFAFCYYLPTQARKYVLWTITFICGSFYVLQYLWPTPIDRQPHELPSGTGEAIKFWLDDGVIHLGRISNVLTAFLVGLGTFSLIRLHVTRVRRKQENWGFSIVLLTAFVAMLFFGVMQYRLLEQKPSLELPDLWAQESAFNFFCLRGYDMMFDGMFQQMDATMFSIIAFFILSAAYRAFRIRSIESTVLLVTALVLILANMGVVASLSSGIIDRMVDSNKEHFLNNFKLEEIANWLKSNIQTGSLRAINFGIAVGTLAMGLRLWLGLDKGGAA